MLAGRQKDSNAASLLPWMASKSHIYCSGVGEVGRVHIGCVHNDDAIRFGVGSEGNHDGSCQPV